MNICIFGLGRIGLPISLVCAEGGHSVVGIDINKDLINSLKQGKTVFNEPGMQEILTRQLNKNFFPKHQEQDDVVSDLKKTKYVMIAVGTGFAKYPEKPNISTLYSIIGQLIAIGLHGKTIILRVTLPVGTSDEIKNMIEKKTGLKEGKDFWFAFVPERIMEGKAIEEEHKLPKIVGCYNDESFSKVNSFFKEIGGNLIRVSNPRTAEFIKLMDNSWRNTSFAIANDFAFLAEENDIDVVEAIKSANAGFERNRVPIPGPVSGYCLGKDPYLLELAFDKVSKKRGFNSIWYYGRRVNDWFNKKIVEETKGENILVAGLSFKENIDDFRYSHGITIVRKLLEKGCNVTVCDPHLNQNYYTNLPEDIKNRVESHTSIKDALKRDTNTIIFTVKHSEYVTLDLKKLIKNKRISNIKIIDMWNIFKGNR